MVAWTRATYMLALTALLTGSLNTLTNTYATKQAAVGTDAPATIWGKLNNENDASHTFDHPFFMAAAMFMGEALCMVVHMYQTRIRGAREPQCTDSFNNQSQGQKGSFWFALPAFMDIFGTGTMYCGLCLSSASVFQMLRGSVVVFTSILSVVWLKRTIKVYQWIAVLLVVIGITVVGYVSLQSGTTGGKDEAGVLLGDVLIVLAQIVTALQMCTEEKLMAKYNTPTLKAIGLEGIFGFMFTCIVLVPMYYTKIDGVPLENVPDALAQMGNNPRIVVGLICNMLSIAMFNNAGISVTKALSATHRMVLDSVRTLLVWVASLALTWESFHWLQLVGFVILAIGTGIYNDIIKLPCCFTYDAPGSSEERPQSFCGGAVDHGSFIAQVENSLGDDGQKAQQEMPLATSGV